MKRETIDKIIVGSSTLLGAIIGFGFGMGVAGRTGNEIDLFIMTLLGAVVFPIFAWKHRKEQRGIYS